MKMKIKDFLNFYIGFHSFQIVTESGDRCTSPLTKNQAINAYGKAELKRTDVDGEEYFRCLVLYIPDKDFIG